MRKAIVIIIILAMAITVFWVVRPKENLLDDPGIQKYAQINAELAIEHERYEGDSTQFKVACDSILEHFGVSQEWMDRIKARIDRHPEDWIDVYELMIEHAEKIKDSLLHKTPPRNDSI